MADEPEDELLLDTPAADQGDPPEPPPAEQEQGSDKAGEVAEEELEVSFGDEAAPASGDGTGLVKHLREQIRDRDRELTDLRKRAAPVVTDPGPRPKMSDPAINFDEELHEKAIDEWLARKEQADAAKSRGASTEDQAREQWQRDLQSHEAKRAALKFPDAEEAEATAVAALNEVQQAVIVKVADNSAQLFYALGKHPSKLAELSQIKDPLKLAAAVAVLEKGLKVMPRRRAPDPEEIASGNAALKPGTDKTLERLEREASKDGADRTELVRYKKEKGLL